MIRSTTLALLLSIGATSAFALGADGVVNIDQSQALAGSVTAGDAPGYPITISTSGTYRLTSNLVVPAGQDGIVINPMLNVTVDLNGFQIVGAAVCSPAVNCNNNNGTAGVRSGHETSSLTVRNGRIRGFTDAGASGRQRGNTQGPVGTVVVEDLTVAGNAYGVLAHRLVARRMVASGNANAGIMGDYGQVQDLVAEGNAYGVWLGVGRVSEATIIRNTVHGVLSSGTVMLHHSTVTGNPTNISGSVTSSTNLIY